MPFLIRRKSASVPSILIIDSYRTEGYVNPDLLIIPSYQIGDCTTGQEDKCSQGLKKAWHVHEYLMVQSVQQEERSQSQRFRQTKTEIMPEILFFNKPSLYLFHRSLFINKVFFSLKTHTKEAQVNCNTEPIQLSQYCVQDSDSSKENHATLLNEASKKQELQFQLFPNTSL